MINQSWRLGTFAKIPVKIHWTFPLILIYVVANGLSNHNPWENILVEVCFVMSMFCCVVLHEFGHALTARRYHIQTEDIILLPIGGVARLRNMPDKPSHELVIAVMGPMVNVIIAAVIFGYLYYLNGLSFFTNEEFNQIELLNWNIFLPILLIANIFLVIFNMIPAFPMDGGRVLRALLSFKLGKLKATLWASRIGQFICILFIGFGIYYEAWTTVLIGVFIFIAAMQEYQSVSLDFTLKGKIAKMVCRKISYVITSYMSVQEAMSIVLSSGDKNFIITNFNGEFTSSISAEEISTAVKQNPDQRISDLNLHEILFLEPNRTLKDLIFYLNQGYPLVVIKEGPEILGVIDRQALDHYLSLNK